MILPDVTNKVSKPLFSTIQQPLVCMRILSQLLGYYIEISSRCLPIVIPCLNTEIKASYFFLRDRLCKPFEKT